MRQRLAAALGLRSARTDLHSDVNNLKLIVGLGNPGPRYSKNRHNIGYQCLDLMATRLGLRFDISKGKAQVALGTLALPGPAIVQASGPGDPPPVPLTCRVLLAKPQTYMNESGQSVSALARFYKVAPADMLVIYDDLDLPVGSLRLRPSGGSGGHNGIKSIIRLLGDDGFSRLRVGIDRPPGRMDPADYVLQDFSPAQEAVMVAVRDLVVEAAEYWLIHGITATMNEYNARTPSDPS